MTDDLTHYMQATSQWRGRAETAETMVADLIGLNQTYFEALELARNELYEAGLTATTAYRAASTALARGTLAES